MAVNTTQGIVLAVFGANAGGHLATLNADAEAAGNAALATNLSAAAGLILGVDLSEDATFTDTVLDNLGIEESGSARTEAEAYFNGRLLAGESRGVIVAEAVEYLLGDNVDAVYADVADSFSAAVTAVLNTHR